MRIQDVYEALSESGIEIAYMAWPKGSAPDLPWAVYYLDDYGGEWADDELWCETSVYALELYQETYDADAQEAVETAIRTAFGEFDKEDAWLEDEDCLMTTYRFTAIDRRENG